MVIVLFGPPGVGKSFVGRILKQDYGFHFYDADEDLTDDMISAIKNENVFTKKMRQNFFNIVIEQIQSLQKTHKTLIVAQALIKEINRDQLLTVLPHIQFVEIKANLNKVNTRLKIRDNWVSIDFAKKIWDIYEAPKHYEGSYHFLDNNQNALHVKQQLDKLLELIRS